MTGQKCCFFYPPLPFVQTSRYFPGYIFSVQLRSLFLVAVAVILCCGKSPFLQMSASFQRSPGGFSLLVNNNVFDRACVRSVSLSTPASGLRDSECQGNLSFPPVSSPHVALLFPLWMTLSPQKRVSLYNVSLKISTHIELCTQVCTVSVWDQLVPEYKAATWWCVSRAALTVDDCFAPSPPERLGEALIEMPTSWTRATK